MTLTRDTVTRELEWNESSRPFYRKMATEQFFGEVGDRVGWKDCAFIVVAHMLPTLPPFLRTLEQIGDVVAVVTKPSSVDPDVLGWARRNHRVVDWTRQTISQPEFVDSELAAVVGHRPFAVLDVGGYFAPVLAAMHDAFADQFLGIVEDTENGHQKYDAQPRLTVGCVSIARSLAKRNEDRWVGQSIVFSAEMLLREGGATLDLREALVIGFGKIGQSIANSLRFRGLIVTVWDTDPNQRVYARCENFRVEDKHAALTRADLVFCATGNRALAGSDFAGTKQGSVVFSVTSADDEFSFEGMGDYRGDAIDPYMTRLRRGEHFFFLANRGNALNFLHGAELRPFVHLTQAAMLHGIGTLLDGSAVAGRITGISRQRESQIAEAFERCFFDASPLFDHHLASNGPGSFAEAVPTAWSPATR
ncbi:NAD(P)-dependent oxidoreductase [Pseudonocardia parietis]|uniref:Adenosylhomocysteinase n=1 Tax=Pseudonocardia parietis TaxID=570936 RepID=A0ABS4W604_9PSEU|nr:NAD(P)-dependent oxidoreductase [Pseudonocardia parietis]MBP2371553.1 adenosylhomocysteinase [Pseudonocardia parietis]